MRRGRDIALGAVFALILAAFLWFVITDLNSPAQWYQENADKRSQVYARQAQNQKDLCVRLARSEQAECIGDAEEAKRVSQHDEQDLAAQKITAWWTSVMGGAAVAGMLISVIGVFLVWTTFRETKEANTIAREATAPVITLEPNAQMSRHGSFVRVEVRNVGQSFAQGFRIACELRIDGVTDRGRVPLGDGLEIWSFGPQSSQTYEFRGGTLPQTEEQVKRCAGKRVSAWFTLTYADNIGRRVNETRLYEACLITDELEFQGNRYTRAYNNLNWKHDDGEQSA